METFLKEGYINFGQYGGHDDEHGLTRFDLSVTKGRKPDGTWDREYIRLTLWDDAGITVEDGEHVVVKYYEKAREKGGKTYVNATVLDVYDGRKKRAEKEPEPVYADDDIPF